MHPNDFPVLSVRKIAIIELSYYLCGVIDSLMNRPSTYSAITAPRLRISNAAAKRVRRADAENPCRTDNRRKPAGLRLSVFRIPGARPNVFSLHDGRNSPPRKIGRTIAA